MHLLRLADDYIRHLTLNFWKSKLGHRLSTSTFIGVTLVEVHINFALGRGRFQSSCIAEFLSPDKHYWFSSHAKPIESYQLLRDLFIFPSFTLSSTPT